MKRIREVVSDRSEGDQEDGFSFLDLVRDIHSLIMTTYLTPTAAWMVSRTCHLMADIFKEVVPPARSISTLERQIETVSPMSFIADGYVEMVNFFRCSALDTTYLLACDLPPMFLYGMCHTNVVHQRLFDYIGHASVSTARYICRQYRLIDNENRWETKTDLNGRSILNMLENFIRCNNMACVRWFFETSGQHPKRSLLVQRILHTFLTNNGSLEHALVLDKIIPEMWKDMASNNLGLMCQHMRDSNVIAWFYTQYMDISIFPLEHLALAVSFDNVNLMSYLMTLPSAPSFNDPTKTGYVDMFKICRDNRAYECMMCLFTHVATQRAKPLSMYGIIDVLWSRVDIQSIIRSDIASYVTHSLRDNIPIGLTDDDRVSFCVFIIEHRLKDVLDTVILRDEIKNIPRTHKKRILHCLLKNDRSYLISADYLDEVLDVLMC